MRIDNTSGLAGAQGPEKAGGGPAKPENRPAAETAAADRAEMSPVARQASGTDTERLAALRTALETGKYNVSADDLARSIMNAHLKP